MVQVTELAHVEAVWSTVVNATTLATLDGIVAQPRTRLDAFNSASMTPNVYYGVLV
jgi:hypothetical protein